ncbi:hypothetical protein HU200_026118 [Digitaria exilis]|uniref:Uncharacterized protein n=1 Tax=Digitaria exilis TaxID=1010633 RepID=A0A835BX27_9POAL|nr:hypothetical protein HU200_026118 [Digitaria exilis]
MEPKKSSPQQQPRAMEPKKSSHSGTTAAAANDTESQLSSLFYLPTQGVCFLMSLFSSMLWLHLRSVLDMDFFLLYYANGKDQDLYNILYKGQSSTTQPGMIDGKPQWNPSKSHSTYAKDSKQSPAQDSVDTSCFGSSVHYGGRDYYGGSITKQGTESSTDNKATKKDPAADSHGEWWQGIILL